MAWWSGRGWTWAPVTAWFFDAAIALSFAAVMKLSQSTR
jgi:hypothetical protein